MSIIDNMRQALVEESKNAEKYLAFAEKAEAEARPQVARLFRAAAASERVHARAQLEAMGEIRSTLENLQNAMATEEAEFQEMYPRFLAEARKRRNRKAAAFFKNVLSVERGHYRLYGQAVEVLKAGEDLPQAPIFVCGVCGNTVVGRRPKTCPICGGRRKGFTEIP